MIKLLNKPMDKTTTNEVAVKTASVPVDYSWVLLSPRITEKAAIMGSSNVYTFNVHQRANKILVKQALKAIYNVTPRKVNIIVSKNHSVTVRGRKGMSGKGKKAMVFLDPSQSIDFS